MLSFTAEERKQIDTFKDQVMVKHARLEEVDQAIALAIEEHADAAHLLFYGPSGVGKSAVLKRITAHFIAEAIHPSHVPVIYLEARTPDHKVYERMDYYRQVLDALKGHIFVKEILMDVEHAMTSPKASRTRNHALDWLDMRQATEKALVGSGVKAVIIDEADHLMQGDGRHHPDEQLDWLKSMTNRTNVLHILSGPYQLFNFRNLNGQAARRGRNIHFPRYHMDNKAERAEFVGALSYLLERAPLECNVNQMLKNWRWFADGSVGCVGILKTWLVDAIALSFTENSPTLTTDLLERAMLPASQRVSLEMEARAGEHEVELDRAESDRQLQSLWGKAANKNGSARTRELPDMEPMLESSSQGSRKSATQRVGQQGFRRDPVGEASATVSQGAANCSFSEVVALTADMMRETTITRVECPVCLAVRDIKSKGENVKFPRHPERVTTRPNQGWRWVLRDDIWELLE